MGPVCEGQIASAAERCCSQVTGAGKGIGRELCKLLAACGAKVVALSRTQSDLDSLSAEIDGGCETFVCDLGDAAAVAAAAEAVLAAGPCPLLVNNAAIAINGPFLEASTDDFDTLYAINVRSVMQVSQILAKAMIAAGGSGVRKHPTPPSLSLTDGSSARGCCVYRRS